MCDVHLTARSSIAGSALFPNAVVQNLTFCATRSSITSAIVSPPSQANWPSVSIPWTTSMISSLTSSSAIRNDLVSNVGVLPRGAGKSDHAYRELHVKLTHVPVRNLLTPCFILLSLLLLFMLLE